MDLSESRKKLKPGFTTHGNKTTDNSELSAVTLEELAYRLSVFRGNVLYQMDDLGGAIAEYSGINPNSTDAYYGRMGEYDNAIQNLDEAIRINRKDAYITTGHCRTTGSGSMTKTSDKAIADFTKAIDRHRPKLSPCI